MSGIQRHEAKKIAIFGSYNRASIGDKAILISLLDLLFSETKTELWVHVIVLDVETIDAELSRYPWCQFVTLEPLLSTIVPSSSAINQSGQGRSTIRKRVVSRFPSSVRRLRNTIRALRRRRREIRRDLAVGQQGLIIGGGNLLMDIFPVWPFTLHMVAEQFTKANLPMVLAGVGTLPVRTWYGKRLLFDVIKHSKGIYVRDTMTLEALNRLWNADAQCHPDFALSYPLTDEEQGIGHNQKKTVAVNVGTVYETASSQVDWDGQSKQVDLMASVLYEYWIENSRNVHYWLFDTNYPTDRPGSVALHDKMLKIGIAADSIIYEDRLLTSREILLQLQGVRFAITTRLHAGLLAARVRTPIIAFAYQDKVRNVLADLGLSNCVLEFSSAPETITSKIASVESAPDAFRLSSEQLKQLDEQNRQTICEILYKLSGTFSCTS